MSNDKLNAEVKSVVKESWMRRLFYPSADICHMLRNVRDSVPSRDVGRYDSDCSADNSDLFATALL